MSSFRKLCETYFKTHDFYEILKITKDANEKEVKKAYHKMSLLVHPDRVDESEKLEATEKFKILGKIHSILSDKSKRVVYDESGDIHEDDDALLNWLDYWRSLFKKITLDDIKNYEKEYIGSETEINDVKKAYLGSKGNMNSILEQVPFSNCDHEPRYIEIIKNLIEKGEVPEYKSFTREPKMKKEKRLAKWQKEKAMADQFLSDDELCKAIQKNQENRTKQMNNFFQNLEEKYSKKTPKKRKTISDRQSSLRKKSKNSD